MPDDRTHDHHAGGGSPRGAAGWWIRLAVIAAVCFAMAYPCYKWFVERVEVGPNELLLVVNKMGRDLPLSLDGEVVGDQVVLYPHLVQSLAKKTGWTADQVRRGYKGIQYDVLKEGRHFISPIRYQTIKRPATLIPEGKFGVLIRKHGQPLPFGQTVSVLRDEVATPTEQPHRGPVSGTLPPGRYAVNPFAYDVQLFDKIVVPEGFVGVQTLLSGREPADPNVFIVNAGDRGVQPDVLGPGTYFDKNPFEVRVDPVDMRSQKYDMLARDAIEFPSNDGFNIRMEATVEWAVYADQAPRVVVQIGDLEDVVSKILRPYATSLARIQGSKLTAREFIGARENFQKRLVEDLGSKCRPQGVLIKAVTVRDLKPPERVRSIIREREVADQTITRFENEIAEAESRAQRVEQEELSTQQEAIGDANREVVTRVVNAEQGKTVAVTQATKRLEVAKLDLESARKNAEAVLARGQADAKVVLYKYQAEAEPLQSAVAAFGDGYTYAQNQFYQKVAPAIRSILSNTEGPFADIFRSFQKTGAGPRAETGPGAKRGSAPHPAANGAQAAAGKSDE